MNVAELFVKCLEAEDVEYVFGVPGEENAHFMMALEESSIPFVLTRHEQGGRFHGGCLWQIDRQGERLSWNTRTRCNQSHDRRC